MSDHDPLADLLGTAGEDAGCEGGFTVLAEYVEAELDGRNVVQLFPAVAAHIHNCPACVEDYRGLLALARERRGAA
ncbi:MAG: hypothetical protein WCE47_17520 [Gaiella sp.]|jgi:hypothetical protein|uniref:hypothetical protein n=1 Tax=Gaiella sp. TaxID=2663207 RepID=UPI002D07564D|nr:hypothetical protein [Gaiella sp.]